MAGVTPKKLLSSELSSNACRCCCSTSVYRIHLFGEKAKEEGLVAGLIKLTQIGVDQDDPFSNFVCQVCARKIYSFNTKLEEFKKMCWESAARQRTELESGRVKRGRKPDAPEIEHSPVIEQASKKSKRVGSGAVRTLERTFQQILPKPTESISVSSSTLDQTHQLPSTTRTLPNTFQKRQPPQKREDLELLSTCGLKNAKVSLRTYMNMT